MKIRLSRAVTIAALTLAAAGCVHAEIAMSGKVSQIFEFGNDGHGIVRDVKVHYGSLVIPSGTAHSEFDPNHMTPVSEAWDAVIPESAEIHWVSAGGSAHDVTAPIRSFVLKPSCFDGFRFMFVDDHVDLYIINRKGDCTKLFDVETTKVFSSKREQ